MPPPHTHRQQFVYQGVIVFVWSQWCNDLSLSDPSDVMIYKDEL